MITKRVFGTAILLCAMAPAVFAASFDEKVRNDFFAGFAGDQAAMERAMQKSEQAIAENPNDVAEALAWHGSGLMFMSGQKFQQKDIAAGSALWEKGLAEMDKAGALAPDKPAVLIPRAAAWFGVSRQAPPAQGRPLIRKALADYEHVYELQKAYFDTLSGHMRGELLFGLADGYRRDEQPDKARVYFEKLVAVGPASGHLEQAQLALKGEPYVVRGVGCTGCHVAGK